MACGAHHSKIITCLYRVYPLGSSFRPSVLLSFNDDTQRRDGRILKHASQALTVRDTKASWREKVQAW